MNSANVTRQVLHGSLGRAVHILLVEDSPSDVAMTLAALREGHIANDMYVANDGEEALDYLFRRGEFRDARRPDLILLDLNLPKKDGRQVLAEIKADPSLRRIPVIVLTTSAADQDVAQAYDRHANAYVRKPVGYTALLDVVRSIEHFWVGAVQLPPREPAEALIGGVAA